MQVAYTFDAGPNACLFLNENDVPEVTALINEIFPKTTESVEYIKGIPIQEVALEEVYNFQMKF